MLRIRRAAPVTGNWIRLTLTDGTTIDREIGELLVGPVFDRIRRDAGTFRELAAIEGTVGWPGGIDLDPDVLIWGGSPDSASRSRPSPRLVVRRPEATSAAARPTAGS